MVVPVTVLVINMRLAHAIVPAMRRGLLAPVIQPVMVILPAHVIILAINITALAIVRVITIAVIVTTPAILRKNVPVTIRVMLIRVVSVAVILALLTVIAILLVGVIIYAMGKLVPVNTRLMAGSVLVNQLVMLIPAALVMLRAMNT